MDRRSPSPHLYAIDILTAPPQQPVRMREPEELTWRHRMMARLMVHGCADVGMLAYVVRTKRTKVDGKAVVTVLPPPEPGEPLPPEEAGRLCGLRKRFALSLAEFPIFKRQLRIERRQRRYPDDAEAAGVLAEHEDDD